jgi:hypothetical protein
MGRLLARLIGLVVFVPFVVSAQSVHPASGAVNFVEGRVTLDGAPASPEIEKTLVLPPGRTIETDEGRAEVLLSPGVFVRLGEKSAMRLVTAADTATRVELLRGQASVEVIDLGNKQMKQKLEVVDKQAYTSLLESGIYLFDVDNPVILVYIGKARVQDDRRGATVGSGQRLVPTPQGVMKAEKFNFEETTPLYAWTEKRALAAASVSWSTVEGLTALDRGVKHDAGWYWNPWFNSWAYVPPDGFRKSPFGYGFYAVAASQYIAPVFESFRQ